MLDSTHVGEAAVEAAERLQTGLRLAGGGRAATHAQPVRSFLAFIQRYAGLGPAQPS
jgi:hypothetical protein